MWKPVQYYGLNNVGAAIWEHLASPMAIHDLCTALTQSFEVPFERCRTEALKFLEQLQAKGLVQLYHKFLGNT